MGRWGVYHLENSFSGNSLGGKEHFRILEVRINRGTLKR